MGRDTFHQTRLLRAPSSLALNTARERAATASLGSLGQRFTTLIVKNFFLISSLNLSCFSLKPLPRSITPCPCRKSLSILPVGPFRYWKTAERSPCSLLFSRLNSPNSLSLKCVPEISEMIILQECLFLSVMTENTKQLPKIWCSLR